MGTPNPALNHHFITMNKKYVTECLVLNELETSNNMTTDKYFVPPSSSTLAAFGF